MGLSGIKGKFQGPSEMNSHEIAALAGLGSAQTRIQNSQNNKEQDVSGCEPSHSSDVKMRGARDAFPGQRQDNRGINSPNSQSILKALVKG
jgi:hypothetical protein